MGQFLAARFAQLQPVDTATSVGDGGAQQEATWWCRLLARVVGTLAGIVGVICGILICVSLSPMCIISGLLLIFVAIVVLVFEAPVCCSFIELTKPIATFAEGRTFFQKAILYVISAIVPLVLCFGISTIFGSGLIITAGVIYGLMGLGRKADRRQMTATATATSTEPLPDIVKSDATQVGWMENENQQKTEINDQYGAQFGGTGTGQRQQFP